MRAAKNIGVCLFAVLLILPVTLPSPAGAQTQSSGLVKYTLKSDTADLTAIDVKLSFNMKNGQKAVLKPSEQTSMPASAGPPPALELLSETNPGYTVEPLQGPDNGWQITATADADVTVDYRVRFTADPQSQSAAAGEAPGGQLPPRAITDKGIKAFNAGDALLVPQSPSGSYFAEDFSLSVKTSEGESVLAPWSEEQGTFKIGSTEELLSNFLAWGKMTKVQLQGKGPRIDAGLVGLSGTQESSYRDGLVRIHDEVVKILGARPEEDIATVLVMRSGDLGLKQPASESLRDSFVLAGDDAKMEGTTASAAARGWLGLWNGYSLVAKPGGGAEWLQDGLPWFYGYRIAGRTGLMDANTAYSEFSTVYSDYLTNPLALTVSLEQAESDPSAANLLETKGAGVLAALAVRLTQSGGSKDMEWFLGQLADKFDGLKGKQYAQVDVSELLEDGTGKSWDRFFSGRVAGEQVLKASEWSTTNIFGEGGVVGSAPPPPSKGSGRSWIYLAIAVLVIFAIPFIFSGYIKRSIKLDVSMPRILPDWDEELEDDESEQDESAPVQIIDTTNPVGEAVTQVDSGSTPESSDTSSGVAPEGNAGDPGEPASQPEGAGPGEEPES